MQMTTAPDLYKEYHYGSQTGDCVCITCGRSFTKQEIKELSKAKENK